MQTERAYNIRLHSAISILLGCQHFAARDHAGERQCKRIGKQIISAKGAVWDSEPLIIFLSLLPGNLFTESPLVVQASVESSTNRRH